ncbi:hypothetical protein HZA56_06425 [Candidatus Poribacteria bacterium]|nr:hypothetical protein [Candidatus Poribacteria bacterium]
MNTVHMPEIGFRARYHRHEPPSFIQRTVYRCACSIRAVRCSDTSRITDFHSFIRVRYRFRANDAMFGALFLCVCALWLGFAFAPKSGWAQEDENVTLRENVPSVPEEITRTKLRDAREDGFSYLTEAWTFFGVDTNVFRSPHGLEESAAYVNTGAQVITNSRFKDDSSLTGRLRVDTTRYDGHDSANVGRFRLGGSYSRPLTENTALDIDLRVRYRSNDATDIFGESFERNFAYWAYDAGATYLWDVTSKSLVGIGGEFTFKDYVETPGLNSLDWTQPGVNAYYRYRFGKRHYLRLAYWFEIQEFKEEPASLADGTELPTNPDEKHRRHEVSARYSVPLGNKWTAHIEYDFERKKDLFEDFESFDQHSISGSVVFAATENTRLEFDSEYTIKDFDKRLADGDDRLNYDKLVLALTVEHALRDYLSLYGTAGYYFRNSNKSEGTTFRDFEGAIFSVGASLFF